MACLKKDEKKKKKEKFRKIQDKKKDIYMIGIKPHLSYVEIKKGREKKSLEKK